MIHEALTPIGSRLYVQRIVVVAISCLFGIAGCGPWDPVLLRQEYALRPVSSTAWQVEKILISQTCYPNEPDQLDRVSITLELANDQRMNIHLGGDMSPPSVVAGDREHLRNRPHYRGVKNEREDYELTPVE